MDEKFIIKEKFLLGLALLEKDMEYYYHMLLKIKELKDQELSTMKAAIRLHEEHLQHRIEKTGVLATRLLISKLEDRHPFSEETDFKALSLILGHPLLAPEVQATSLKELSLLQERISLLKKI